MLKVINRSQLQGTVSDADQAYFFCSSGRKTEQEYLQLLLSSQYYFFALKTGKLDSHIDYHILVHTSNCIDIVNGKLLYVDYPIRVRKTKNGYIFCGDDGRHRYIIAQKYKLDLLVDVTKNHLPPKNFLSFIFEIWKSFFRKKSIL